MIRSMTGFGRATCELEGESFAVEIRSVNHRHLDVQLRLPRPLAFLDAELRAQVKQRFTRGKLEVTVTPEAASALAPRVRVDLGVAARYVSAAEELQRSHPLQGGLDVATLLSLPGVASFADPELPQEALLAGLLAALHKAAEAVERMRASEGAALQQDLEARLDRVTELIGALEDRVGAVQRAARERWRKRFEQLARDTGLRDEARLYQELALAADRLDVTEELVRLRSHVAQFRALLAAPESVGRRLEFLIQELGREINTIGSKGGDAPIAHTVVEFKGELERMREQVQNIE